MFDNPMLFFNHRSSKFRDNSIPIPTWSRAWFEIQLCWIVSRSCPRTASPSPASTWRRWGRSSSIRKLNSFLTKPLTLTHLCSKLMSNRVWEVSRTKETFFPKVAHCHTHASYIQKSYKDEENQILIYILWNQLFLILVFMNKYLFLWFQSKFFCL